MKFLANKALNSGCGRMEWVVLDWNTSAQIFYENLGAVHMKEWFPYRMDESALQILANT
jgi:diamine N-acetyltransferase